MTGAGGAARAGAWLSLAALAAAGCAERGIPPGGPVDDVAPTVLAVEPADGARGVASGTPIRLTFSEAMDRESVERALRLSPNAERAGRSWEGNALVVTIPPEAPAGTLGERIVALLRTAEDRRGNRLAAPLEIAFTSGDSIPGGAIEGRIGGELADARARVLLFRVPGPALDSLAAATPLREVSPGSDGAFRIRYLTADGADTLALFALSQPQARPTVDAARDRLAVGPDTLVLSPAAPRLAGLSLTLARPDAPGSFRGRSAEIPAGATVHLRSLADSAHALDAEVDSTGSFLLDSVPPGLYRLLVLDPVGGAGSRFPGFPETLRVRPGEKILTPGADSLAAAGTDTTGNPPGERNP